MTEKEPIYYLDTSVVDDEFGTDKEYKYRVIDGEIICLSKLDTWKEEGVADYYKTRIQFSMDLKSIGNYFETLIPLLQKQNFKIVHCKTRLESEIIFD